MPQCMRSVAEQGGSRGALPPFPLGGMGGGKKRTIIDFLQEVWAKMLVFVGSGKAERPAPQRVKGGVGLSAPGALACLYVDTGSGAQPRR